MNTNLTFWQNSLSIHQAPLIRELAARPNVRIRVVAERGVSAERANLGWTRPDYGAAEIHVAPNDESLRGILQEAENDDAHIFSGIGVYPMVETARTALSSSASGKLIASTESTDTRGLLRKLRFWARKRKLSAKVAEYDSVLACGAIAVAQWRKYDDSDGRVKEFGYFVDRTRSNIESENVKTHPFQIVFVGSLQSRKDPCTLLKALSLLPSGGWQATFVGDGPLQTRLKKRVSKLGIAENVEFYGTLTNDDGRRVVAKSSVLVLPSKHDGWGAVVNEALMDGVPSVVSRNAGASTLIRTSLQGATFQRGDANQLAQALRELITFDNPSAQRQDLIAWSEKCISPQAAADYLLEIVRMKNATRIVPPWGR